MIKMILFLTLFATHLFCQPVLTGKNQWLKPLFATTCQPWFTPYRVRKLLKVYILQVVYFVYLFSYSITNIKRLMHCTPKMSDNACSLHCYDTADNNVKVHWHYRSPKCARPGRISSTLCLNAPFVGVCENSYFYEMAHVIIKCRVKFGKKMFNDCIKPHYISMRLVLSTQEEFSLNPRPAGGAQRAPPVVFRK